MSTLWTKSWKRISPFNAVQITDNDGAFSVWPNITPREVTLLWGYDGPITNFTLVLAKLYRKLWGNDKLLNFLAFVGTDHCELKSFSDMVL